MSKQISKEEKPKQSQPKEKERPQVERCLALARKLKKDSPGLIVTPTLVTEAALKVDFFTADQLAGFTFQGARRRIEQFMKTLDDCGLPIWGQLPLVTESGEMGWDLREDMNLRGHAWNYLLRDDVVAKNMTVRNRWRTIALRRWTAVEFDATVDELRAEREENEDVA